MLSRTVFRKPVLWGLIFLSALVGLYLLRPSQAVDREQSKVDIKPPPVKQDPKAYSRKARDVDSPKAGSIPENMPKVELKMDKRRPLTPREDYMAPRWSRDGLDVLVTKGKYKGLYLVSHDGTDIRQISDEPGVGYHARWSPDGNYIIVENEDDIRYYDRSGRKVDAEPALSQTGPPMYAKDGVVYHQAGSARSEADSIVMADEDQYFEPVLSPDETKIAYIGLESGIVIRDLQTQEDVYIGHGTDVSWLPDGSGFIFNYTQDDGERIIDGDIYFAYADGSIVENLTNTPDTIERHPNLSWDGSQLTYDVDGRIYSVEVVSR